MKARTWLLPAAAAIVLAAGPSSAGPGPVLTDPRGDTTEAGAPDILSATLRTEGVTRTVNGRSVYRPTKLVATVTFASPPKADNRVFLSARLNAEACRNGVMTWRFPPNTTEVRTGWVDVTPTSTVTLDDCASQGTSDVVEPVVRGTSISWTFALASIEPPLESGAVLDQFMVESHASDRPGPRPLRYPLTVGPQLDLDLGPPPGDMASSRTRYVIR